MQTAGFMSGVVRVWTFTAGLVRWRVLPWFRARPRRLGYAAAILGGLMLVCYVAGSSGDSETAGTQLNVASAGPAPTSQPSTQPTDTFYDPTAEGADPRWALPAELTEAEVKGLIAELDQLQRETRRLAGRVQAKYDELKVLDAEDVRQAIWQRVTADGFKERKVPLLYHQVMRDGSGLLPGMATDVSHQADRQIFAFLNNRIAAAQVRLLGGQCLVGDKLFIKATAAMVAGKHAEYDELESKRNELVATLGREFSGFDKFREELLRTEQSSYLRLPHSEGYRRLPGATKDQ